MRWIYRLMTYMSMAYLFYQAFPSNAHRALASSPSGLHLLRGANV
jgi:hypothetical protein